MRQIEVSRFLDSQRVETIADVAGTLTCLNTILLDTPLSQLRHFNGTYLHITHGVLTAVEQDRLQYPDFMQRFDTQFADLYFSALSHYCRDEPTPLAWRLAFEQCQDNQVSPLRTLANGVIAHVLYDIPQALQGAGAERHHAADYQRVNTIIDSKIRPVLETVPPHQSWFNHQNRPNRPAYTIAMRGLIRAWRRDAWRSFEAGLPVQTIENRALKMAQHPFLRLPIFRTYTV